MIAKEYEDRLEKYRQELEKLGKRSNFFVLARLVSILAALLCGYLWLWKGREFYILPALLLLAGFLVLVYFHADLKKKRHRTSNLVRINREELEYLGGDLQPFEDGSEFADNQHWFSADLDLFGEASLFRHLNRTASRGGKQYLAGLLRKQDAGNMEERQEAVQELSRLLDLRQQFRAAGLEVEEDEDLRNKLRNWLKPHNRGTVFLSLWLLYPLTGITVALIVNLVVNPSVTSFEWLSYSFMLNLGLVFFRFRDIRKEYENLTGISGSLLMYAELLNLIESTNFNSHVLKQIRQKLKPGPEKAGPVLRRLGRIADGFDQVNNVVALLFTNGLYHNHLHLLRSLYRWKNRYGHKIGEWLDLVAEMDAWCSIAGYAFNHPDFTYPQKTAEPFFEAKEIGHPLLDRQKRVTNDLYFDGFRFVILTGSNMAGKSTFLRTLGVNLVLAKAGAPVCATSLKVHPFKLLTSMKVADSLSRDESYFQAEINRLKKLQDELEKGEPALVLLDEILRGTNSSDKRNGTRLFMEKISRYQAMGLIATHDIDIAELANGSEVFKALFFESKFVKGELVFDYKLRPGVCTTPNATALMKAKGII